MRTVTEEARAAKHPYDKLQAQRAVEIDTIEAEKPTSKARLRLLQALLEHRSFDRAI